MEPLRELLRYHAWATSTLIEHCAALPPEVLGVTVPGTAGTIMEMLVHLVAAEGRYLAAFGGPAPGEDVREGTDASLDLIRVRAQEHAARWETLLDRWTEQEVTLPARRDWPETPHARTLLLLQTLHHGDDHRTHIATILGASGQPVPEFDGWAYWGTVHHGLAARSR